LARLHPPQAPGLTPNQRTSRAPSGWERDLVTAIFVVLALSALVSGILCSAVLTGRVRPRQRSGVLSPDPKLVRRKAAAFLAGNVCVLLNMIGFLVFPDSVVVVTAALLPMWIVSLVLLVRVRADAARPRG
jgi:hypothetical protein